MLPLSSWSCLARPSTSFLSATEHKQANSWILVPSTRMTELGGVSRGLTCSAEFPPSLAIRTEPLQFQRLRFLHLRCEHAALAVGFKGECGGAHGGSFGGDVVGEVLARPQSSERAEQRLVPGKAAVQH